MIAALCAPTAAATTTPEFIAAADQICAAELPKDARIFSKAVRSLRGGDERTAGRLFIRSQRIELVMVNRIAALPQPTDSLYDPRIDQWIALQGGSARTRIRFARGLISGKPLAVLDRIDNEAARKGNQAAKVGSQIGFQQCA